MAPFDGVNGDDFGFALALHRDTLVVGSRLDDDAGTSSGSAYVFHRHQGGTNNWGLAKKLTADDAAGGDEFGFSVAVEGDTIAVGAHNDVQNSIGSGSAYVFARNTGGSNNWGQVKKLIPFDGLSTDDYGHSVAVDGDIVAVGANRHDHPGNDTGTVYIYERDLGGTTNYALRKELLSPTALNNDQFGYAIALDRDKLVVGAPFSGLDNQSKYGAAFAYSRHTGGTDNWGLLQKLERTDSANNDQFGLAVAIGQDTAVVGASMTDTPLNDAGSVYIYRLKYNNAPEVATSIPDISAATNVPFSFTLAADIFGDHDVTDTLTLTASLTDNSPLPSWLTFDPLTGQFSGTPLLAGTYLVRVTATDQDGASVYDEFLLVISGSISPAVPPVALSIHRDVPTGEVHVSYDRPLGANSADYVLEISEDLATWSSTSISHLGTTVTPLDALTEHVVERINAQTGKSAEYFRLRHP
jgi:hypothetical protein